MDISQIHYMTRSTIISLMEFPQRDITEQFDIFKAAVTIKQ